MPFGPVEALLVETIGRRLLAYLCNASREQIERRIEDGESLHPSAEAVITSYLVPLAEEVATTQAEQPGIPAAFALELLGQFDSAANTTVANALRAAAGGHVRDPTLGTSADTDPVKALLFQLARDAYPQLLAPVDEPWRMPHLNLFRHPARVELESALAADEHMSRLHHDEDPGLGRRGVMYNSLGRGGSIQSVMFGETVISAAWDAASMSIDTPTLEDLLRSIDSNVDVIREAIAGRQPQIRALLVFTGIISSEVTSVPTPWGVLRPLTDTERIASPAMLEGQVSGIDAEGKSVTVSYAGELVLDTTLPYELVLRPWDDMEKGLPDFPSVTGADALRRRAEGVQLAALLAIDRPAGSWATARLAWQWASDPLSQGRLLGWMDTRSQPGFMPYELTSEDCDQLAEWTRRIETHGAPHIEIAVRRVLSAAHARADPADRLVDAVIAWENLFGTSEGEPRLRISSAIAWLVKSDNAQRASLQDRIKRLYDDRSKIVHGGTLDTQVIGERANEALALARQCLQILLRDRPDLLHLPDGAARSLRLILGG